MLSDSLLGSVLVESVCFLLIIAVLLLWKKPKKNAANGNDKPLVGQAQVNSNKNLRHGNAKMSGSLKSRRGNAMVRGDLSGESTDAGNGSWRSSDTEVSSSELAYGNFPGPTPAWFNGSYIQPLSAMPMQFAQGVQRPYVPCPLDAANQEQMPDTHGDSAHDNLAKIISKLSPEDAATVMASLNAASSTAGMPVILYPHPVPMMPRSGRQREGQAQYSSRHPREGKDQKEPVQEPRVPKNQPPPGVNMEQYANTLKENLRQLSSLDPKTVILVRKISKLGMNSPQLLEIYFSQFGPVKKVFISHAIEKPQGRRTQPRWRPATLGFVAMENVEDAEKAMQRGTEQTVLGVTIQAVEYEDNFAQQQKGDENDDNAKADDAEEVESDEMFIPDQVCQPEETVSRL
jgi:hypothetical protein